jgi:hypothetical protein
MVHIVLEARYDDFKAWAIKNNIHPFIIGFLGFLPDLLRSEVPASTETNQAFCTPRAWSMLSNIIDTTHEINSIHPVVYGTVGYAAGIELISFVKVYKTLPDIDAILNGDSQSVPEEPSALYALCAAIIEKYENSSQAKNLFAYSKDLPVEFAVMLIKDLILKDESIAELDEFEEWLEKYGEYIV